ncbi:MAG: hypothetical protein ACKOCT_21405, partial [Alphaproteobacteria bacterium]
MPDHEASRTGATTTAPGGERVRAGNALEATMHAAGTSSDRPERTSGADSAAPSATAPPAFAAASSNGRVLVVEDDDDARDLIAHLLR